ncbi:MAG: VTT domain-containing protein, partial [Patescibacteria group bacterium]
MLSAIIKPFEDILLSLAHTIPLELFVPIGSFVEEIIAPIPSPLIMITAGSIASLQGRTVAGLFVLSLLGAIGKTIGAVILYILADKGEDFVFKHFGKYLGFSHKDVESIGKHFNGGIKDDLILLGIRSLPVIPSAPVSLVCGVIKIKFRTFVTSTFLGTIIRDSLFLYFGYSGLASLNAVVHGVEAVESFMQIGIFLVLGILIGGAYYHRHKR